MCGQKSSKTNQNFLKLPCFLRKKSMSPSTTSRWRHISEMYNVLAFPHCRPRMLGARVPGIIISCCDGWLQRMSAIARVVVIHHTVLLNVGGAAMYSCSFTAKRPWHLSFFFASALISVTSDNDYYFLPGVSITRLETLYARFRDIAVFVLQHATFSNPTPPLVSPKCLHVLLAFGLRRAKVSVGLIVRAISFQDFQPIYVILIHQR